MNWDALGAVAELLAAVGVIVSIVYLARQVKDNTDSVKADTYQRFCDAVREINMLFVTNEALVELSGRLLKNDTHLTDNDRRKAFGLASTMFRHTDNVFYQYKVGTLDEEQFKSMRWSMVMWMQSDLFRELWKTGFRDYYSGSMREFTDNAIKEIEERRSQGEKAPNYKFASVLWGSGNDSGN